MDEIHRGDNLVQLDLVSHNDLGTTRNLLKHKDRD